MRSWIGLTEKSRRRSLAPMGRIRSTCARRYLLVSLSTLEILSLEIPTLRKFNLLLSPARFEGAWGARGAQRPLLEVKRTWRGLVAMSPKDTKRTYGTVLAAIGLRHQPRYNQNRLDIWECGA